MFPRVRSSKVKAHLWTKVAVYWTAADVTGACFAFLPFEGIRYRIYAFLLWAVHLILICLACYYWYTEKPKGIQRHKDENLTPQP